MNKPEERYDNIDMHGFDRETEGGASALWKALLIAAVVGICCLISGTAGCGPAAEETAAQLKDCGVLYDEEFGGVYIQKTIDEFNELGFAYGDSVDILFSNGYSMEDVPYYNGYYTKNGENILVAYPGYPYIKAAINNGDSLWALAGLKEGDTAEITLNDAAKYFDIQNARDIHYQDEREEYPSDVVFANFRSIQAGDIPEGVVYRSASPCDNQHNRAPYVDALMEEAGVNFILNLADTEEKIEGYLAEPDFDSPYFLCLYQEGKVLPIALNMNYGSDGFQQKLTAGLTALSRTSGPCLVHCTEGKDRTGFVCMLLEALAGASYREIVDDYMITYDNYYQIAEDSHPDQYRTIVENLLEPMIEVIAGEGADFEKADLSAGAEKFLKDAGMTQKQIDQLRNRITGEGQS